MNGISYRSPEACTTNQVLSLSGFTNPNNHAKWSHEGGYQLNRSAQDLPMCIHGCVHTKEVMLATYDQLRTRQVYWLQILQHSKTYNPD